MRWHFGASVLCADCVARQRRWDCAVWALPVAVCASDRYHRVLYGTTRYWRAACISTYTHTHIHVTIPRLIGASVLTTAGWGPPVYGLSGTAPYIGYLWGTYLWGTYGVLYMCSTRFRCGHATCHAASGSALHHGVHSLVRGTSRSGTPKVLMGYSLGSTAPRRAVANFL